MPKKKARRKVKVRKEKVILPKKFILPKEIKEEKTEQEILKKITIKMFGRMADRYSEYFSSIRESLVTADMRILFRTYLSMMFFATLLTFLLTFIMTLAFSTYLKLNPFIVSLGLLIIPCFFASITFLLIYVYPVSVTETRKRDIEANLPFALTHMAAIAESGAPPITIFRILSEFEEYGEISKEAGRIKRDVEIFGLDELSAIKDRLQKNPSPKFKDILQGILTTIQTGGDLKSYLFEESKKTMFEYTVRKEKYNELLAAYADLYTALLIAAPMIFIVVLSILAVLGGNIFNLTFDQVMTLGVLTLSLLNMIFLTFLHVTQPKM